MQPVLESEYIRSTWIASGRELNRSRPSNTRYQLHTQANTGSQLSGPRQPLTKQVRTEDDIIRYYQRTEKCPHAAVCQDLGMGFHRFVT